MTLLGTASMYKLRAENCLISKQIIAKKLVINLILSAGVQIDTPFCMSPAFFFFFIFSTYKMSSVDYTALFMVK